MKKLYPNQLPQHLATTLAPCYLIFGEEPLQRLEAVEQIRQTAKQQGFSERLSFIADNQFDWNILTNELNAMSLFASQRLIELELPPQKLATAANEQLKTLAASLHPDIVLLIYGERSYSEVSKLAWFKQLQQHAVQIPVYPLDDSNFIQWLRQRAGQLKLRLTADALTLLQHHCAGNLLAAKQELEKLLLLYPEQKIDADMLSQFLADHSAFTVFQLTDALLAGDAKSALHRLERLLLQDTEAVIIIWHLQKEVLQLRQLQLARLKNEPLTNLFKTLAIWPKRQPLYQQALQRLSVAQLDNLLQELAAFDRCYKNGQLADSRTALTHLICLFIQPVSEVFSLRQAAYD